MMINKRISGDMILFTDETKIEMGSFFNNSITLLEETNEKLQRGEEKAYELINKPQKKFEPSIIVAGGICKYGLNNLILLERPPKMNFLMLRLYIITKKIFKNIKIKEFFILNKMVLHHIPVIIIKN